MQATTDGSFRVLDVPHAQADTVRLLDLADLEPTLVEATDYDGELADQVAGLRPGYVVDASLVWDDGTARFTGLSVTDFTLIEYAQGVSGLFEAALDTMSEARHEGLGVTGRPTYSTDGEPNGAVYAFAEQRGERDLFEEIRSGTLPLEPLVHRLESGGEDAESTTPGTATGQTGMREDPDGPLAEFAHEIFVMRPVEHNYVIVYLVGRRDSILADTVRDTYDCPRPAEPLR